jgi:hypothetical protein
VAVVRLVKILVMTIVAAIVKVVVVPLVVEHVKVALDARGVLAVLVLVKAVVKMPAQVVQVLVRLVVMPAARAALVNI